MKKIPTLWWIIGVLILIAGLFGWSKLLQNSDSGILAQNGLHWHPSLTMYVKGEEIEIPQNIGIGAVHNPIHTHEDLPVIHLEFGGIVRAGDLRLGEFFKVWGKDIRSFGALSRMTVNGAENTEYENYMMRDGDKIELHYE